MNSAEGKVSVNNLIYTLNIGSSIQRFKFKPSVIANLAKLMSFQSVTKFNALSSLNEHVKITKLWLRFIIVLKNWIFHAPVYVKFCEKISAWHLIKVNWFKSWNRMIIRFVFAFLNGPTRNYTLMSILPKQNLCRWCSFSSWYVR